MIKKITSWHLLAATLLLTAHASSAQEPVPVGKGSYAAYTPLVKSWTPEHAGDKSRQMETKPLFVREDGGPIPTNDWWTDLLNTRYSGNLWAYPQVVNAEEYGIYVAYPTGWTDDGCEMKWNTRLELTGRGFSPESAVAERWHDWGVEMSLAQADGQEMRVTLAHGMPFTWVETRGMEPRLRLTKNAVFRNGAGEEVSLPVTTDRLLVSLDGDAYGVYAPEATTFSMSPDGQVAVGFAGARTYLSIAVLPDAALLDAFAPYAPLVPRDTRVDWSYDETSGRVRTSFQLTVDDLDGRGRTDVLQGFLPHHYKRSTLDFSFTDYAYDTPRGRMKLAVGHRFDIDYEFKGMLPYVAAPVVDEALPNPYDRERMVKLIADYAAAGSFGGDTYWGGKGLTQMALYMTFAREMGEETLFARCRDRLKEALVDWLTYTPGENNFFFARYNRWGAMVGYDTSYDSDTFNDHHFHYGYFTYAGALLCLVDEEFCRDYGAMLTLLAKDYANWDRDDRRFPLFRTLDPWAGHSYAGGLGGWNGNGQESTSEAMQGWGGLYLLGVATGDRAMRDAGIFGWVTESRGTAEYWFDRDRENIRRDLYTRPYNSNLTSQGIGWWTWFSGDPVWMHSIQWMPISPCLDYLSEDLDFARWDYTQMWASKQVGGWDDASASGSLAEESGLGNVVLSYLQRFDPDSAARVFDRLWEQEKPLARNPDTGGISYYIMHAHRTYGDRDWTLHADVPTASAYRDRDGRCTYVVYNAEQAERQVTFYEGTAPRVSFRAPAGRLTVYNEAPVPTCVELEQPASSVVPPGLTLPLRARVLDQYGAGMDRALTWSATGGGTVDADGLFRAGNDKGSTAVVTVCCADRPDLRTTISLRIDDAAVLAEAVVVPERPYLQAGSTQVFSLQATDQYGEPFPVSPAWSILRDGRTVKTDSLLDLSEVGCYTVVAQVAGQTFSQQVYVLPGFPDLALGRTAASSSDNGANTAARAFDGDRSTRWESVHGQDPQWLSVDLGSRCYVASVVLVWEPAYASLYELQVSDDGQTWTTIRQQAGRGGTETIRVDCEARYVRMLGLERATAYGYSIYDLEVHGVPEVIDDEVIFGIGLTAPKRLLQEGEPVRLTATAYNGRGEPVETSFDWQVVAGQGSLDNGLLVPQHYGTLTVEASAAGQRARLDFVVEERVRLHDLTLAPRSAVLIVGDSQPFAVSAADQFGCDYPIADLSFTVEGGEGATFADGVFTATQTGIYKLVAEQDGVRDTATIRVAEIEDVNLALGKWAGASGNEGENEALRGNDGDLSTRWSSTFEDGTTWMVDLSEPFVVNRVRILWETSYARAYRLETSLDGENWTEVYATDACTGGTDECAFADVAARYVRIVCLQRSSVYGSSFWELEVYGRARWQQPVPVEIRLPEEALVAYVGETLTWKAVLIDQYGLPFAPQEPVTYATDGGGTMADNVFTPLTPGSYVLTVSYAGLTRRFPLTVRERKQLSRLAITPDGYLLKVNEPLTLTAQGYDQYDEPYPVMPVWSANVSAAGVFCASSPGEYIVGATVGDLQAEAVVRVVEVPAANLLLRKPVSASSGDGTLAVDGNSGSRWIAADNADLEWLQVDMQGLYELTDVEIAWERASAADYEVRLSADGEQWSTLASEKGLADTGADHTETYRVSGVGRYLQVYCTRRNTVWPISVFELKAFGVAATGPTDLRPVAACTVRREAGRIFVSGEDLFGCSLLDAQGCVILRRRIVAGEEVEVSVDGLRGCYFLWLQTADGTEIVRLLL